MILPSNTRFFLYAEPADMRRGFDRLAAMVRDEAGWNPLEGAAAFLFVNRRADRLKMLLWDGDGYLLCYKRLVEGAEGAPPEAPPEPEPEPVPVRKRRKGHGRAPIPEHLPREVVVHELPAEERLCPCCGEPMAEIGHDRCEQLDIVPAELKVIRHERAKYACGKPACKAEPEASVHTAERPTDPVPRCKATPRMLAAVAVDKFADHTPLYRLQDQLARRGVHLARSTMCGWLTGVSEALEPLHRAMLAKVLATGYVHHDDTTVRRLQPGAGKCGTGRFWVAVGSGEAPYSCFDFTETRTTKERDGPLETGWIKTTRSSRKWSARTGAGSPRPMRGIAWSVLGGGCPAGEL